MTTYIQTLRNKSIQQAQSKLNRHRQMGTKSELDVFEVAKLMDAIKNAQTMEQWPSSIFYNVHLN
jgi:hypothetical protein